MNIWMFQKIKMLWKPHLTELPLVLIVALDLTSDHHNILTSQPAPMCTPSPSKAEVSVKLSQSFKSLHSECNNSKNRCNIFSSGFHHDPRLPEVPLRAVPLAFPGSVDRDCRALAMAEAVHVCLMQEEADFQARDQGYKCWKRAPEVQIKSGALKISKIWIQHTIPLHRKVEEHRSIFQRETRETERLKWSQHQKHRKHQKHNDPKVSFVYYLVGLSGSRVIHKVSWPQKD